MPRYALKPKRPVLDRNNPLVKKLYFDMNFWRRGGLVEKDLGPHKIHGTLTNAPTWVMTPYGPAIDFAASNAHVRADFTFGQNAGRFNTFQALFCPDTLGESSNGRIFSNASTSAGLYFFRVNTNNVFQFLVGWTGGTGVFSTPSNSIVLGAYNEVIVEYDNSSSANVPRIWINGVEQTVTVTTAPSGSLGSIQTELYIGTNGQLAADFDGKIVFVRMWSRFLSIAEIKKISADPWCFYRKNIIQRLRRGPALFVG